ncbi:hypothetical protein C7974DRAFT_95649 [Boeremia exigua]|uniref:uncharacterized protein n=1 Tax=Boeremia exigua TaxID=749465 RepID=UPI001E8DB99F|nr:uncharacterized protein C7974DRAFT_95649 [Boeremia exigua]KAH6642124.1 hypothetical protein C7974DRAFT_95649 [Boeremia exigua]
MHIAERTTMLCRQSVVLVGRIQEFYAWVDGEVYENTYVTLITNLDVEARALEQFKPLNLTREERDDRRKRVLFLRAAIRTVQTQVRNAYAIAYDEAVTTISTLSAGDSEIKAKAQQMRDFCAPLRNRTIVPLLRPDVHADDADDLLTYKVRPLAKLNRLERFAFWREKLTSDVIASSIGRGCAIVDVRSLLKDRAFVTMLSWYVHRVCDIIHHRMIYPSIKNNACEYIS